jgi:hypothetical protein
MPKSGDRSSSKRRSGVRGTPAGGTKALRISPQGSSSRKGGNPGGTNEAGDHQVQGASHQGSSLGKRNSG